MAAVISRVRRSRAQWQSLVERAERSGLGVGQFCRHEGVSTASFYAWRRRLGAGAPQALPAAQPTGEAAFLDLGTLRAGAATDAGTGWEIELDLGAGAVLRLRRR
jgi:transposase-like protein